MAIKTNTFEGGTHATNLTIANSGGANGDALNFIIINNVSTPAGGSAVQYSTAAAINGSLGVRMTPAAAATYVRWNEVTGGQTRYVCRRGFTYTGAPSAMAEIMTMRTAAGAMGSVRIATDGKPYFAIGVTDHLAAKPASALTAGDYFFELAITLETGGGGNGVIAYRILDTSEVQVHTFSASSLTTGTTVPEHYRFGGVLTTSGWSADDVDSIRAGDLASGWIGGLANLPPTGTISANQNVAAAAAVTATVSASDSDGSIASYAWSVVTASSTSTPTLTGGTTDTVSFTAPAAGHLVKLQCIVTDNGGATLTLTTEVRVSLSGAAASVPLALNGTGVGTWTIAGGSSTDGAALADASDATYLESPTLTVVETSKRVRLQPTSTRASGLIKERLWTDTGSANVTARLYEGTTLRQSWTQAITTTATEYTFTMSAPTVAAVTDWGNLYLEVAGVS